MEVSPLEIKVIDSLEPTFNSNEPNMMLNTTEKLEENISKIHQSTEKKEILQKWLEYSSEEEEISKQNLKNPNLYLAIEKITDPVNLGSIIRSASFFKVDGIILPEKNSCPIKY
jgi:tRNA G18 (ribose-2'-O)-methylase SpoU